MTVVVSPRVVVFVPSPPLLLIGDGLPDLRAAVAEAVSALEGLDVVVVGRAAPGEHTGEVDVTPWTARGTPSAHPLPLALAVGRSLVDGRLFGPGPLPPSEGLLVVGDGTAKRSLKAPGHLDERAAGFDALVLDAIASGDPRALLSLDAGLAEELWVDGLPAWQAAAVAAPGPWSARVLHADAPYGVFYVVAVWLRP